MVNSLSKISWKLVQNWLTNHQILFALIYARHYENHKRGMLYVIQQNNCVCANQSGMCTCTHNIIYNRVFRAWSLHIILSTVCSTHVKKLWCHWNTIFVLLYCLEYHLTVSRNKRNDILFIGKLSVIRVSCFIFSVSSACTLIFLVLKWMLATYFVECYVWSCVMFEDRFTLCFKVVR